MAGARSAVTEAPSPRERQMRVLLTEWEASGLPAEVFARRHGMAPATLSWWRWAIAKRASARAAKPAPRADFVQVEVREPLREPAPLEVVLSSGMAVRVAAGFDAAELTRLLTVLEAKPC